jgi:hypothetical protein
LWVECREGCVKREHADRRHDRTTHLTACWRRGSTVVTRYSIGTYVCRYDYNYLQKFYRSVEAQTDGIWKEMSEPATRGGGRGRRFTGPPPAMGATIKTLFGSDGDAAPDEGE